MWTITSKNVPSESADSKNSDQPAQMHNLIRIHTGGIMDNEVCKVSSCWEWRVWPDCTDVKANLCLRRGHMSITRTRLYNFDPLKPHFYIVKLGFTGVYINFLISAQNIDCGYPLEPPRPGGSNEYPHSMFWSEIWKISEFFIWKFSFFGSKIFCIFE